ncbi:MAG TPA: hypothetical protein VFA90_03950 [Terriglobales bacterium]|nr:hypothetical protein [Terriglobales bacterium]
MDEETQAIKNAAITEASRNQTAKRAAQILLQSGSGFVVPSAQQKRLLLVEFARRNFVLYGKAFDIIKLGGPVDLDNTKDIEHNLDRIILCEIKSSGRKLPEDFRGYFFALTAAELLVAQSLKKRFQFVLVNTATGAYSELTLQQLFGRARGIYPTWSIMF